MRLFGTLDFQQVAAAADARAVEHGVLGAMTVATLLLFLGATGKSAQIPLYVWLPDAMEGPTPVSALIHAATMVTAGVYMIGRNAVLFSHAPTTLAVVAGIGAATALFAGTIGLVQNDIKRVLAYSTVSQLGYMFLAMGVGAFAAGIFHLYTHAFFKALLFLGSGAVIHALAGEQDLRNMGGLKKDLPITYWTFLIGALAIAGVPLLSGFFSKDEILYRTFTSNNSNHVLLWAIGAVTSLLTAIYMFRLVFLAFHGRRHVAATHGAAHPEEEEPVTHAKGHARRTRPVVTATPAITSTTHRRRWRFRSSCWRSGPFSPATLVCRTRLAAATASRAILEPSFRVSESARQGQRAAAEAGGTNSGAVQTASLQETRPVDESGEGEHGSTELMLMAISSGIAIAGIGIAAYFWLRNRAAADRMSRSMSGIYNLLMNKYYIDELYDAAIVQPIKLFSTGGLWKGMDAGVVDGAVNGVGLAVQAGSSGLRRSQTGSVRVYAGALFVGVVAILGFYLWR